MAFWRGQLDLAIPLAVWDAIPAAKKQAFRDAVRELKAKAVRINAGLYNEEVTVKATFHKCYHDQPELNRPCEPSQEI